MREGEGGTAKCIHLSFRNGSNIAEDSLYYLFITNQDPWNLSAYWWVSTVNFFSVKVYNASTEPMRDLKGGKNKIITYTIEMAVLANKIRCF